MTTGTNREPPSAFQVWVHEQLDVRPGATDDEARRELLKQLGEMDFMPPSGWDSALRVAGMAVWDGDVNGPVFVPARRAAEEALRAEVEEFAERFFSLLPPARQARFDELLRKCAGLSAVCARLEGLRPALDLPCELPAGLSPEAAQLVDQTRRLFVLRRQERSGRRLAFLQQCRAHRDLWQQVASNVQAKFARISALEPALFRELCASGDREKLRDKIARQRRKAVQKQRRRPTATSAPQKSPWWIWVVVVMALNGLRVAFNSSNHSSRPSPQTVTPQFDLRKANEDMNKRVNEALRRGEPMPETLRRLYGLPPETKPSPRLPASPPPSVPSRSSPRDAMPSASPPGVDVRIFSDVEQARKELRQLQERQSQAGPRAEMHVLNAEQAREMLRQLREQQAQFGPDSVRDSMIRGLENAVEGGSQKQP